MLDARSTVVALKAAAEPTRLRILALLASGELTVSDLTAILGQSQPRVSRHLKLLSDAGLIDRFRDGSWVYVHLSDRLGAGRLGRDLVAALDSADPILIRDRQAADRIKAGRQQQAQSYFQDSAAEWDQIRALHVDEELIEAQIERLLGAGPFELLVDLGTGTGRMLELLASRCRRGLGVDANQSMLAYARSRLQRAGLAHAQVRQADLYDVPLDDGQADAVVMHQVLHFLADPQRAIGEAARILAPGGRLLVVDFAAHDLEELRERFRHQRLGFATQQVSQWLAAAGLSCGEAVELARPVADGRRLAVTLWPARRPSGAARRADAVAQRSLTRSVS